MTSTAMPTIAELFAARFPNIAGQLAPADLALLLDGASVQEVAAGRTLIRDRMPVDFLYFVLDGAFGVHIENAGKSMRLATVNPGEWLGEISVLSGELLASATIIADTDCTLVKIHHLTFEKLIAGHEAIAKVLLENFIGLMAQRLRAAHANG